MFKPNTGLYLYRITLNPSRKKPLDLGTIANPTVKECLKEFATVNLDNNEDSDIGRRWFFTELEELQDGFRFKFDYGRNGFGSRILDGKTRKLNYDRKTSDLEVIPLLSRVWIPESGNYGVWGFQSFGQHSCNGLILQDFKNFCQNKWKGLVFNPLPIVPSYLESYKTAPVTAVTLKTRASGDAANKQVKADKTDVVKIDVRIATPKGGTMGKLMEIIPSFSGKKAVGRQFGGQEYEEAYATIDIDGRSRTVSLYGPAKGTGLIDLDDVKKVGGHPEPSAFFEATDKLIEGVVKEMGIE